MKFAMILVSSLLILVSCTSTITPVPVISNGPSWDGGIRNSGFYGYYTNSIGTRYAVISEHARDRYNNLISIYNKRLPILIKDYGIQDNGTNCYMTLEALSDFIKMNRWQKEEFKH